MKFKRVSQFAGPDRWNRLVQDVDHFSPREVLFPEKLKDDIARVANGIAKTSMEDWLFDYDYTSRILREQFGTATLDGFGLAGKSAAVGASGAMIHYVRQTQKTTLEHITGLNFSESAEYLSLDAATIRPIAARLYFPPVDNHYVPDLLQVPLLFVMQQQSTTQTTITTGGRGG